MPKLQNVISCTRRSLLSSKMQQEYTIRNFDNRASAVSRGAQRGDRLLRLFVCQVQNRLFDPFQNCSENKLVFPRLYSRAIVALLFPRCYNVVLGWTGVLSGIFRHFFVKKTGSLCANRIESFSSGILTHQMCGNSDRYDTEYSGVCPCELRRPRGEMQAVPCGARFDTRPLPASGAQPRSAQIRSVRAYNARLSVYFNVKTVFTFLGRPVIPQEKKHRLTQTLSLVPGRAWAGMARDGRIHPFAPRRTHPR